MILMRMLVVSTVMLALYRHARDLTQVCFEFHDVH